MKRIAALFLALVLLLSLAACGEPGETTGAPAPTTNKAPATNAPTTNTPTSTATQTPHVHDFVTSAVVKEPTCTQEGTREYTCDCGEVKTETIEAKGHSYANADCTTAKTCTVCGATEGAASGHSYADATCTAPKTCTACGATEGEAKGHSYADATCTTAKTCTACGATEGEAKGHSYADATCTTAKTCTICGATEGEAKGHSYADATCTKPQTCTVCGATEGEANGHSYADATCTAPQTCTVCGKTKGDPADHDYQDGVCKGCGKKQFDAAVLVKYTWMAVYEVDYGWGPFVEAATISFTEDGNAYVIYHEVGKLDDLDAETREEILQDPYVYIVEYKGEDYYLIPWDHDPDSTYTVEGNIITVDTQYIGVSTYEILSNTEIKCGELIFTAVELDLFA